MPNRRLTETEQDAARRVLLAIGCPSDSIEMSQRRVYELDPGTGQPAGEIRPKAGHRGWLEVLGVACDLSIAVKQDGSIVARVRDKDLTTPDGGRELRMALNTLGAELV